MKSLDLELGKWLLKQRPGLMVSDSDQMHEALDALASALGCLLATVKVRAGESAYAETLQGMFAKADDAAQKTYRLALLKRAAQPLTAPLKH